MAKFENIAEQERKNLERVAVGNVSAGTADTEVQVKRTHQIRNPTPASEKLKVTLRRGQGDVWTANPAPNLKPDTAPRHDESAPTPLNLPTTSVAENVSSFLSGIRASFRSENVIVTSSSKPKNSGGKV